MTRPQRKPCYSHRKFETPWSRAPGVYKENLAPLFDHRLVRVTKNHPTQTSGIRIELHFREVVKTLDVWAADLDHVVWRKSAAPPASIVVAANRTDRRNLSEALQNGRVADIATMNNEVRVP